MTSCLTVCWVVGSVYLRQVGRLKEGSVYPAEGGRLSTFPLTHTSLLTMKSRTARRVLLDPLGAPPTEAQNVAKSPCYRVVRSKSDWTKRAYLLYYR